MANHSNIIRFLLIFEKLNSKKYASLKEIVAYLKMHDIKVSERTLQRDFKYIRNEFGLEIKFDHFEKGYFIHQNVDEDNGFFEKFINFLEIVNTADLLVNNLSDSKQSLNYISFDSIGSFRGIKHLKHLLKAIQEKRMITFAHLNYQTNKITDYTLKPYLLREYLNRWYVVGIAEGEEFFKKFGVDRIDDLKITEETFKRKKNLDPNDIFDHIIGLEITDHKLQPVILSFTPKQGKYIKSLKLHRSQKILIDNEKELRIELMLIPNFELTQKILMHGSLVKVIEPNWLAENIQKILRKTLKKYK